MKRYWLFTGHEYENDGGLHDLQGTFDSISEAKALKHNKYTDWGEIVDSEDWKVKCKRGDWVHAKCDEWEDVDERIGL